MGGGGAEGVGGQRLYKCRGQTGNQTLYHTDKAIYLASQLSSMQLLSAKITGKEGKVYQLLVKH